MNMPEFDDLPFNIRPDLSPYIVHLTKNIIKKDQHSAFKNLVSILQAGEIRGSDKKGFIKGPNSAACFMDVPLQSLKYILNESDSDPDNPRYEPFGIIVTKKWAYRHQCRPVLYLSNNELKKLKISREEQWRVVRLEVKKEQWISWIHEREWRCKGNFKLPTDPHAVLVKGTKSAKKLHKMIEENPKDFKVTPRSIIPLTVMCQGLPYLSG
jgi:hypothetical protein